MPPPEYGDPADNPVIAADLVGAAVAMANAATSAAVAITTAAVAIANAAIAPSASPALPTTVTDIGTGSDTGSAAVTDPEAVVTVPDTDTAASNVSQTALTDSRPKRGRAKTPVAPSTRSMRKRAKPSPVDSGTGDEAGVLSGAESDIGSKRKRGPSPKISPAVNVSDTPGRVLRKRTKVEPADEVSVVSESKPPSRKDKGKAKVHDTPSRAVKAKDKAKERLSSAAKGKGKLVEDEMLEDEYKVEDEDEEVGEVSPEAGDAAARPKRKSGLHGNANADADCHFVGNPIPFEEAMRLWPARYEKGSSSSSSRMVEEDPDDVRARQHFRQAMVEAVLYNLDDCVYVKADGADNYIGKIVEFFEGINHQLHFTAQWFYRTKDTVIMKSTTGHDARRLFISEDKNVNPLDCIVSKLTIVQVAPNVDLKAKSATIPPCDFYYDMSYSSAYSTFANIPNKTGLNGVGTTVPSTSSKSAQLLDSRCSSNAQSSGVAERTLLDLYSGCGAMSTGLCLGAKLLGENLVTKWAVDLNSFACESLQINHPESQVRNEKADDFLILLREWEKLCQKYGLMGSQPLAGPVDGYDADDGEDQPKADDGDDDEDFEVGKIVGIRHGDPQDEKSVGLKLKVRWKGYGPKDDSWEPIEGLRNCEESIESFVRYGYNNNILPLPGTVDVICGGPPCQGVSGFNRFRNTAAPLDDTKNQQLVVFMDIVKFLKPKHVLMENVVDLLKFSEGFLGRYAVGRLVELNYQARLGILAAGSFGLPQFRMRCFLWGAHPLEKLPRFPLPTHDVVVRGGAPNEWEANLVAFNETEKPNLQKALVLGDAISDLPPVDNDESRDVMDYGNSPKTDFQRLIRMSREDLGSAYTGKKLTSKGKLYDHKPLNLNPDDYARVCQIPKKKGANFRDLPGVVVGPDNKVEWDPKVSRVLLPSGKPLVPDYAMTFNKGKSSKPFGRLWWDGTVPTVVTRAEPHNQIILHPLQDRVLTIRENARLQGFPDFYRLHGPIKQRYMQVGNAVAVPVSRALGYSLALTYQREGNDGKDEPVFQLPSLFPCHIPMKASPTASESDKK